MSGFRFRLERLLSLRTRAEREQAARLGAARREEAERAAQADEAREAAERAIAQASPAEGETLSAGDLRARALARDAAEKGVELADEALRTAEGKTQEAHERWSDVRREQRSVEKLRERRLADWREAENLGDRKAMDDVATRRHATREENP